MSRILEGPPRRKRLLCEELSGECVADKCSVLCVAVKLVSQWLTMPGLASRECNCNRTPRKQAISEIGCLVSFVD